MSADSITVVGMSPVGGDAIRAKASQVGGGVVIDARDTSALNSWKDVERVLSAAFCALRDAKRRDVNVVAIVRTDDEFGRRGPLPAMVACALTSAVRTLALEARGMKLTANVVACDEDGGDGVLDTVCSLLSNGALTGQVLVLGRGHLGKVPL